MLTKLDQYVLGAVVLSLVVNVGSSWVSVTHPAVTGYLAVSLFAVIVLWVAYKLVLPTWGLMTDGLAAFGRFAVLVYIVSSKDEFLLICHPHHKLRIPPGGRLRRWELPSSAVRRIMKDEAGITATEFEYHPDFHEPPETLSERVRTVVSPFQVQQEQRRQRGLIRFHYAFVYVCRLREDVTTLPEVEKYNPRWYTLSQIADTKNRATFDDVPIMAEEIVSVIRGRPRGE